MIWQSPKISQAVSIQMGQSPASEYYNSDGVGIPFFQGKADFTDRIPRVRKWCSQPIRIAKEGDILLSVRAPVGPTNIAPSECCIGRGLAGLRAIDSLMLQQYLWYFLKYAEPTLSSKGQGGIFSAVSKSDIGSLSIPLPPLSEQQRIVDILDQADALRQKRVEADEKMQRVLPALFYKMFGDPLLNEMGFEVYSIGNLLSALRNGTTFEQNSERVGYPVTRIETISDGTINTNRVGWVDFSSEECTKWRLNPGDILFSHINSELHIGKTALYEGDPPCLIHGMNLLLMRPNLARVIPQYLHALLNSESVRSAFRHRCKRAVNQASLNQKDITTLQVSVAPKSIQLKFSKAVACYQNSRQFQSISHEQINRLFDILLHRAFSGELTAKWREAHMKELLKEMEVQTRKLGFPVPDEEDRPSRVTDFPNPLLEKKAILLAYIIFCSLEAKHPMARVKLAKQYYFVNQFMQQPVTEHFKPMAAGPLDDEFFAALELAQDRKWVVIEPQKGKEKPLSAGVSIVETRNLVVDILGPAKEQVDEFLESTKDWGWETLERWATVHSVALKLIDGKYPLTVESVKSQILTIPEWEAKLKRCEFSSANINKALIGLRHWGLLSE